MAEILRPSLVLLRRSTPSSAKKRQRLPEAVGVEVWQPDRHECLFEHDTDRTGADYRFARRLDAGNIERRQAVAAVRRYRRSGQRCRHGVCTRLRGGDRCRFLISRIGCRLCDRRRGECGLVSTGGSRRKCWIAKTSGIPQAATYASRTIRFIDVALMMLER